MNPNSGLLTVVTLADMQIAHWVFGPLAPNIFQEDQSRCHSITICEQIVLNLVWQFWISDYELSILSIWNPGNGSLSIDFLGV